MQFLNALKRKTIITGHYGSGKTEFSVSLAMLLAQTAPRPPGIALIDLDIVNPYFRSRERRELLESRGVTVCGSYCSMEITAELPALGATVRTPLEDNATRVIIDLGGNDSGAMIIKQFAKYFADSDTVAAAVVNANRPDTGTASGVLAHIAAIEKAAGLTVTYLINNTHLLRETTVHDIEKGHELCLALCSQTGMKLLCDCYPDGLVNPAGPAGFSDNLMPLGLYMRPAWLDK